MPKTIATAATDTTFGMKMAIRKKVLARRKVRLSRFARKRASNNCGMVDRAKMPNVLTSAFQKYSSDTSRV